MLYQLSRDDVIKVCSTCERFDSLGSCCKTESGERKTLQELKKCKKWEEFYGGPCLFRG